MTTTQSPSIDFNQMLVVSVFFHFFLFVMIMFLPSTQKAVRHIKPAFMVSLINIPAGPDAPPAPQSGKTPVPPLPPEKSIPEKLAPSKALSELDKLTKLEKMKTIPKKDKLAMAVPKPKESVLKDFEKMKMKTAAEKKPTRKVIAKDDLTLEELEFEQLSKKSATHEPQNKPKKKSSLFKDLEELKQMNMQNHAALSKPKAKQGNSKDTALVEQLEFIKKEKVQNKIDTSKPSLGQSEIRKWKMSNLPRKVVGPAASGEVGEPGADAISLYLGLVKSRIDEHWKDPLGGGTGMVQVSFTIFPKGNIAMPKIVKSSGESKLDNLAIRAIKNAVPLPPFPIDFKEPNLPLTFEFNYEPSKN
jgi:TonB family protein